MGLMGTFEGYVPGASDLYLRGNNPAGFTGNSSVDFNSGQIYLNGTAPQLTASNAFNLNGYSRLNIECNLKSEPDTFYITVYSESGSTIASLNVSGNPLTTASLTLLNANLNTKLKIKFTAPVGSGIVTYKKVWGGVTRIWLS